MLYIHLKYITEMITLEFSLEVTGQGDASTVYFVTVVLFTDKMRFVASSFWNRNPSRLRYVHLWSRLSSSFQDSSSNLFSIHLKKIYSLEVASPSIATSIQISRLICATNEFYYYYYYFFLIDIWIYLFQSSLPNRNRAISILLFARISFINWSTVALYNFIIYLLFF